MTLLLGAIFLSKVLFALASFGVRNNKKSLFGIVRKSEKKKEELIVTNY